MSGRADRPDVVVTGLGVVSSVGPDLPTSLAAALAGRTGIRRCDDRFADPTYAELPVRVAAPVDDVNLAGLVPDAHADLFSRGTGYALAAAREALDHAGLFDDDERRSNVGVVCGAAGASADLYFDTARAVLDAGSASVLRSGHAPHLSSHVASAMVGLSFGLHGPNLAAAAACATGTLATILAADQIRSGRAEVMLAGATESAINPLALGSFVAARAVNPTDDPVGACRPFDRRRAGLVFGEGAAFLVLESRAHAEARGAEPLARLLGDALTNDAHHMWAPEPGSWGRAIARAVADAGLEPSAIDAVSAHAAGTPAGDLAETVALRAALGDAADDVAVWSTKGVHGHAFAASSAIELALSISALRARRALPTVGLEEPGDGCDLPYVGVLDQPCDGTVLLKDSFGFMGTNAILVLEVLR